MKTFNMIIEVVKGVALIYLGYQIWLLGTALAQLIVS